MTVPGARRIPLLSGIATKVAVFAATLVVFTAVTVGVLQYRQHVAYWQDHERQRLDFGLRQAAQNLLNLVETARRQTLALAGTPPIQRIASATKYGGVDPFSGDDIKTWKDRLTQIFLSLARSNPELLQIRYIAVAENGKELVRVDRRGPKVVAIANEELQNKGDRDYVTGTLSAPVGSVRLFGIDLNREHGEIEIPKKPVLRVGTPIYDEAGSPFGLIVLNIDMRPVLAKLPTNFASGRSLYVTNESGDYLVHPDVEKTFAFDFGGEVRLQNDIPEIRNLFDPAGDAGQDKPGQLPAILNDSVAAFHKVYFDASDPNRFLMMAAFTPVSRVFAEDAASRNKTIAISGALAIVGGLLAIFAAGLIVRPLKRLTGATAQLVQGHALEEIDIPTDRPDEVGELGRAFRNMAVTLRAREDKLKEKQENIQAILETAVSPIIVIDENGTIVDANPATSTLFGYSAQQLIGSDITILMTSEDREKHSQYMQERHDSPIFKKNGREALARHADGKTIPIHLAVSEVRRDGRRLFVGIVTDLSERYRSERLKDEFVSTVSHELRTPLTSIKGSLGLLKADVLGDLSPQAKSMISIAHTNCDRLVRLINDMLDIEKIQAGKITYDFKRIDLVPFLERTIEANRSYGEEFNVVIRLQSSAPWVQVQADRDRLAQVLTNLLSNAVKHSPSGGIVEVRVAVDADQVRVSVVDNGPGIPADFRGKIFGKFCQADSADNRQRGGSGLGLSIAKAIVEDHGGTIGYDTEVGKGTEFHFDLPALPPSAAGLPQPGGDEAAPRILICEDEPDMRGLLKLIVERMGFSTQTCANAAEAKELLQQHRFAAMTLDLEMPGQNGLHLLSELRRDPKTRNLPVIVVSAFADGSASDAGENRMDHVDWLAKPIDVAQLKLFVGRAANPRSDLAPRILHVEDNEDHRDIIEAVIGDRAQVDFASSIRQARQKLLINSYEIVILDLELPDGHGQELLPMIEAIGGDRPHVLVFSGSDLPAFLRPDIDRSFVKSQATTTAIREGIAELLNTRNGVDETETEAGHRLGEQMAGE
ncbi:ATP-binding protein [Rhodobium gokarnense]|uniref:histidine kinase n=1 Tax=Rhodobium gokarnense TaxID=364296 RepID=A0ABT3HFC6_9HYPH|nr:ATP-binding protein [Rhodobium gokarnense]MCW2309103.1 PAS domain S-box-containing protein [Rhodobium gokarnense]